MSDRLDGWKAVAGHVRKSVRTAQRWERELGLPVHRMQADSGEIVYAFASEIEAWIRDRERGPRPRPAPAAPPVAAAPVDAGFGVVSFHHAAVPQMVPGIDVPLSAAQRALPWIARGGILLVGTLLGWSLARL